MERLEIQKPNQKTPRQFGKEDQEVIDELRLKFGVGSKEVEDYIKVVEAEESKKRIMSGTEKENKKGKLLKQIEKVLQLVDSVELIKTNKKVEKILQQEKDKSKELIEKSLKSAQAYTARVENLSQTTTLAKSISDTKVYQEKVQSSDQRRRQAHEALISDINIALRYLNEHFVDYGDEILGKLEEKFEERNEEFIRIKRVRFPENVFLPTTINLKNRNDLAKWAVLVTEELAKYRQALS